jgi:beta-galactosidase
MADMGMNLVRVAELAWASMEIRDGEFTFEWLEEFVAIAGKKGLKAILGTPQEMIPVWLRNSHPEVIRVDESGLQHGDRGQRCNNSPVFRFYSARITREMAKRFANNPNVAGWQIDNEFKAVECHCHSCQHAFQVWLRKKYETIENLNDAWGTQFWSQHYNSFEEVTLPSWKEPNNSVSHIIDYKRFVSHSVVDFQNEQARIIRSAAPHHFISHNHIGLNSINMYDAAKELDMMGLDVYPAVDEDYKNMCKWADLVRSVKHDNFWMLEQKNGYFNGANYDLAIKPGLVRAWGYWDIARGANAVLFYRYRANRWGQEQSPNGILRHDGSKRRAYYEIQQLSKELAPISKKLGQTKIISRVAIMRNYDDVWAMQTKKQYANFDVDRMENDFYRNLLSRGVMADFIHPEEDLSGYDIVIAPSLMLLSSKTADNMKKLAEAGGTAIFGIRTGIKDMANVMVDKTWPGLVRDLCGVTVDEFEAFPDHVQTSVNYRGKSYIVRWWADILTAAKATAEAVYENDFYQGKPAVTVNRMGKGKAVYFGVAGCEELIGDYLDGLLAEYKIPTLSLPDRVFVSKRKSDEVSYTFVVNMGYKDAEFDSTIRGIDVLSGKQVDGKIRLDPLQTMIIEKK